MGEYTEAFVGIDVAKARNAIAIAEGARGDEVRYFGEIDATVESMRRAVNRIAGKYSRVRFCYEAGPTGYGLHRLITDLGHECIVVAPSLIPRKPGDRVKTNKRDAAALAKLLRAAELTAVWVPDRAHEAMRDLIRTRAAAVEARRKHRQQVSAFMLKHGRIYPRKKGWTVRYLRWLQEQKFDHLGHQIALQEMFDAVRVSTERVERLDGAIAESVPSWSLAPLAVALQALRGVDLIVAATFASEIGDLRRFKNPRQLMAYLGLVPTERSTGDRIRRGGITKAGNGRVRHMLIEAAWTYRHPPRVGAKKLYKLANVPRKVGEIAWKAQSRLTARYRALNQRGKKTTVVCAAIARELVGFMWAIAREAQPANLTDERERLRSPDCPIRSRLPTCSELSRSGLETQQLAGESARRPSLTAPARVGNRTRRVGTKKRASRSN
jgi:transposase